MPNLYERLGGELSISTLAEILYGKIYADKDLAIFFANTERDKMVEKQVVFLKHIFGGPQMDTAIDMRSIHAPLVEKGLNGIHYNLVIEYINNILKDLGICEEDIIECLMKIDDFKTHVLNH